MNAIRALLCILLPVAMPAFAQDARWELVDPGILNHSSTEKALRRASNLILFQMVCSAATISIILCWRFATMTRQLSFPM